MLPNDLVQPHLVAADITSLETALASKIRNLSPEDRQRYGNINEHNKVLAN